MWDFRVLQLDGERNFVSPLLQNYVKAAHSREFYVLHVAADWQVRYLLALYMLILIVVHVGNLCIRPL